MSTMRTDRIEAIITRAAKRAFPAIEVSVKVDEDARISIVRSGEQELEAEFMEAVQQGMAIAQIVANRPEAETVEEEELQEMLAEMELIEDQNSARFIELRDRAGFLIHSM